MKPKLYIVTPSNRECNLPLLCQTLERTPGRELFDFTWWVIFDLDPLYFPLGETLWVLGRPWVKWTVFDDPHHLKGIPQMNHFLDMTADEPNAWCLTMADDTLPHPNYFRRMKQLVREGRPVIITDQYRHERTPPRRPDWHQWIRGLPSEMHPGHVDGGQCTWQRGYSGDLRFNLSPVADGEFIEALWDKDPGKFRYVHETLSFFEADLTDYEAWASGQVDDVSWRTHYFQVVG